MCFRVHVLFLLVLGLASGSGGCGVPLCWLGDLEEGVAKGPTGYSRKERVPVVPVWPTGLGLREDVA